MGRWEWSPPSCCPVCHIRWCKHPFLEQDRFKGKLRCRSAQESMGAFLPGLARWQPRLIGRIILQMLLSPFEKPRAIVLWCSGRRRGPTGCSPWEPPLQPPPSFRSHHLIHSPPPSSVHRAREAGSGLKPAWSHPSVKTTEDSSGDAQITSPESLLWVALACRDQAALRCGCAWERRIPCPQTGSEQRAASLQKSQNSSLPGLGFNQSFQVSCQLPVVPPHWPRCSSLLGTSPFCIISSLLLKRNTPKSSACTRSCETSRRQPKSSKQGFTWCLGSAGSASPLAFPCCPSQLVIPAGCWPPGWALCCGHAGLRAARDAKTNITWWL